MKSEQEKLLVDKYYNLLTEVINNEYFQHINSNLRLTKCCEHTYINVRVPLASLLNKEHFDFLFALADKYKCELRLVNQEFRFGEIGEWS